MRGIGYFLGATLGAAILFLIISFIFLRPRKVNNNEIVYISVFNNSDWIPIGWSTVKKRKVVFEKQTLCKKKHTGNFHFLEVTGISTRKSERLFGV